MSDRSLQQIFEELQQSEFLADPVNIPEGPGAAGFQIAANQAREALPALRSEYRKALFKRASAVFVSGPAEQVNRFSSIAGTLKDVVSVNVEEPYRLMAEAIEPTMGSTRVFSGQQYDFMCGAIRDIALAAGMTGSLPAPKAPDGTACHNLKELVSYLRKIIRESMGDSLGFAYLAQTLTDRARSKKIVTKRPTIVFTFATPEEQNSLLTQFASTKDVYLASDSDVNESFVIYETTGKEGGSPDLASETEQTVRKAGRPKKQSQDQSTTTEQ